VNLIVPTLVLGLGVDYGAYLVTGARERGGMPAAIRSTGRALLVTGFTTIAGFGFLGLSRYPALSGMGILAAEGLLLALVASIVLVPALWAMMSRE
jgi:predicted RND superfamily exporter protein